MYNSSSFIYIHLFMNIRNFLKKKTQSFFFYDEIMKLVISTLLEGWRLAKISVAYIDGFWISFIIFSLLLTSTLFLHIYKCATIK